MRNSFQFISYMIVSPVQFVRILLHASRMIWRVSCEVHTGVSERRASALRYVGVMWFLFHVLQLLLIRFTQQLALDLQIYNETSVKIAPPLILLTVIGSACLWISSLDTYSRSSQLCLLLSVESLWIFEDVVQSLLNMCLYDVCFFDLTEPHATHT